MHTVRNRLASRPPVAVPSACVSKLPAPAAKRHDPATVPRGSMAIPLAAGDESGLIEQRPQKRRNPKGKKARKAAARLAAVREAQVPEAAACAVIEKPRRAKAPAKKGKTRGKSRKAVKPEQLPAIPAAKVVLGTYSPPAQVIAPPALTLPVRPEPLVEPVEVPQPVQLLPVPAALLEARIEPAEPRVAPQPEPEPEAEQEPEPEPAIALTDAPLPRARALVPARRQGLVDVIAFFLRDSGRRLARWSARRHKTREERAALRRAEARQVNLQRELEALDMLRRNRG